VFSEELVISGQSCSGKHNAKTDSINKHNLEELSKRTAVSFQWKLCPEQADLLSCKLFTPVRMLIKGTISE